MATIKTIGILGASKMGFALARAWMKSGHRVVIGSGTPGSIRQDAGGTLEIVSYEEAARAADVIVVATTWRRSVAALERVAPYLAGKTVLDCTNPEPESGTGLVIGHSTSGGEVHQKVVPGAYVVKTLNHLYAEVVEQGGRVQGERATSFYCTDHATAAQQAKELIEALGLEAVFVGELRMARCLEPLAALIVEIVRTQGYGPAQTAFRLLHEVRS